MWLFHAVRQQRELTKESSLTAIYESFILSHPSIVTQASIEYGTSDDKVVPREMHISVILFIKSLILKT